MSLNIKSPEVERLAREVSNETGESLTDVLANALRERLKCLRCRSAKSVAEDVADILSRVDALPHLNERTDDEILGYDSQGTPR